MLKKTIKYEDLNGQEREETLYFNLSKAEIAEMELTTEGGLQHKIDKIIEERDGAAIIKMFKDLVLDSYGEKSPDGRSFIKFTPEGVPLSLAFSQTLAYNEIFMELATDADAAADFVNGILPGDLVESVQKQLPEK